MSLGCGLNTASLMGVCEQGKLMDLTTATCIEYGRQLDSVSTAQVTVGVDEDCCKQLGDVRTWANELVINRDGQQAWSGPILRITYGVDTVTFHARDRLAWLDRRVFPEDVRFVGSEISIARQMIEAGMRGGPEDRCLRTNLRAINEECGEATSRKFDACQASIGAELRELATGRFNFTVLGRTTILFCDEPLGRTNILQDKDLLGEVEVIEDGYLAATAACVRGEGVRAYCGGADDYYGLLEVVFSDDSIDDVKSARQRACSQAQSFNPPPVILSIPEGVRLSPDAPVDFAELVPGVEIPVWSASTCRTVNQNMALVSVAVRQGCSDEGEGADEQVLITLAPRAVLGSGETAVGGEDIG